MGRPVASRPIAPVAGAAPRSVRIPLRARRGRGIAAGVAGAVLAFLVLTAVQALGIGPYLPPDELFHVSYAVVVGDGRLPTLTTPAPAGEVPLMPSDGRPRRIYTANHPPLFYLPESVVLRFGSPAVELLSARLLSACFGAAGVLMVAWLALILLPSRPRVVVAAAWFVALLPAVPHYSAFVYNDGLGFLASTTTLVAGALALRRGPTRWRMTGLAAAAAAAALTRAPGLALIGFPPQDHPARLAFSPSYVSRLFDGLWVWSRFATRQVPVERALVLAPRLIALAVLGGLAAGAVRGLRGRTAAGLHGTRGRRPTRGRCRAHGSGGLGRVPSRRGCCWWGGWCWRS